MLTNLLLLSWVMAPKAELLLDVRNILGEGPVWHSDHRALYWTDIEGRMLHRAWSTEQGWKHETQAVPMRVGGFTVQTDGTLVLFGDEGRLIHATPSALGSGEAWKLETWIESLEGEAGLRFNDGAADSRGRVFFGTFGDRPGRLYRFDPDGSRRVVAEGVGCSNGIDWTPDEKFMYHVDSTIRTIWRFAYDVETGELSNRQEWVKWSGSGVPDGLTVDQAGHVWVAIWGERCVVKLSPEGKELLRIETTSPCTTAPTFGGDGYRDLFVTAAKWGDGAPAEAGALYRIANVGPGRAERRSQLKKP